MDCRAGVKLLACLGGRCGLVRRESTDAFACRCRGAIGSPNRTSRLLPRPQIQPRGGDFSLGRPVRRAASLLLFSGSGFSFQSARELGAGDCREDGFCNRLRESVHFACSELYVRPRFQPLPQPKYGSAELIRSISPFIRC